MKKLPIGIQSLGKLIEEDYIYIDKTKHIYNLIKNGQYYFLSRPRRFGKSLLCSTFKEIFSGNKELFKDCWIYNSDFDWKQHPVVLLDFNAIKGKDSLELELSLSQEIDSIARENNVDLTGFTVLSNKFTNLIKQLSKKNKVVLLIDEYDKPLLENIIDKKKAEEFKKVLADFYETIKSVDSYLKFCFLTGVTKFSQVSLFSKLNNLDDISISEDASVLLGYTKEEIISYFKDYIKLSCKKLKKTEHELLLDLKKWYDGYCFYHEAEKVYSPFSILLFFKNSAFKNYWFQTGTPTFLINLIKEKGYPVIDVENLELSEVEMGAFEVDNISLKTLLFQTGYLTILSKDSHVNLYKVSYPNYEVRFSLYGGSVSTKSMLLSGTNGNISLQSP